MFKHIINGGLIGGLLPTERIIIITLRFDSYLMVIAIPTTGIISLPSKIHDKLFMIIHMQSHYWISWLNCWNVVFLNCFAKLFFLCFHKSRSHKRLETIVVSWNLNTMSCFPIDFLSDSSTGWVTPCSL